MILKTIKPVKKEIKTEEVVEEKKELPGVQNKIETDVKTNKIIRLISTIIVIIIVIVGIMISTDYICVKKYNVGPFFAIRTKLYNDGGTKVYTGIGYKVIKYHQEIGRRDTVYGSWKLKYSTKPTTISDLDLALEFRNNHEKSFTKFNKAFLKIASSIYKVDTKNNKVILRYIDEDKSYTLKIVCSMAETNNNLSSYGPGNKLTVIGTVDSFKAKTTTTPNEIYLKNCFAE